MEGWRWGVVETVKEFEVEWVSGSSALVDAIIEAYHTHQQLESYPDLFDSELNTKKSA